MPRGVCLAPFLAWLCPALAYRPNDVISGERETLTVSRTGGIAKGYFGRETKEETGEAPAINNLEKIEEAPVSEKSRQNDQATKARDVKVAPASKNAAKSKEAPASENVGQMEALARVEMDASKPIIEPSWSWEYNASTQTRCMEGYESQFGPKDLNLHYTDCPSEPACCCDDGYSWQNAKIGPPTNKRPGCSPIRYKDNEYVWVKKAEAVKVEDTEAEEKAEERHKEEPRKSTASEETALEAAREAAAAMKDALESMALAEDAAVDAHAATALQKAKDQLAEADASAEREQIREKKTTGPALEEYLKKKGYTTDGMAETELEDFAIRVAELETATLVCADIKAVACRACADKPKTFQGCAACFNLTEVFRDDKEDCRVQWAEIDQCTRPDSIKCKACTLDRTGGCEECWENGALKATDTDCRIVWAQKEIADAKNAARLRKVVDKCMDPMTEECKTCIADDGETLAESDECTNCLAEKILKRDGADCRKVWAAYEKCQDPGVEMCKQCVDREEEYKTDGECAQCWKPTSTDAAKAFVRFDRNHDGVLSSDEFAKGMGMDGGAILMDDMKDCRLMWAHAAKVAAEKGDGEKDAEAGEKAEEEPQEKIFKLEKETEWMYGLIVRAPTDPIVVIYQVRLENETDSPQMIEWDHQPLVKIHRDNMLPVKITKESCEQFLREYGPEKCACPPMVSARDTWVAKEQRAEEAAEAKEFVVPEEVNTVGLTFTKQPPGPLPVKAVEKDSWAEENGIHEGMILVAVNGKNTAALSDAEFTLEFRNRPLTLELAQATTSTIAAGSSGSWSPEIESHNGEVEKDKVEEEKARESQTAQEYLIGWNHRSVRDNCQAACVERCPQPANLVFPAATANEVELA